MRIITLDQIRAWGAHSKQRISKGICGLLRKLTTTKGETAMKSMVGIRRMANILGVHPNTLRRRTSLGELPAHRIGHSFRYSPSEVLEATQQRKANDDGHTDETKS